MVPYKNQYLFGTSWKRLNLVLVTYFITVYFIIAFASLNNNRNCIGYEYYEGFQELMNNRFKNEVENYDDQKIDFIY